MQSFPPNLFNPSNFPSYPPNHPTNPLSPPSQTNSAPSPPSTPPTRPPLCPPPPPLPPRPRWRHPPSGAWRAGKRRRSCSCRNTQIRKSWMRSLRRSKTSPQSYSPVKPGFSRNASLRPPLAMPSFCKAEIALRVSRSSMLTTSVIPSGFFFRWVLF
uniref:Uncharacterized protein n=1 Tax=Opuntia streptacantha TaxID=393608 RepID=A0A7C9AEN5_OPUST